jgi:glycine cleavage system H protein
MADFIETKVDKFTFKVATDRFYSTTGIWVLLIDGGVRIGLSDFLQQRSGDIAFVDVKPAGTVIKVDDEVAAVETVKINSVIPSPISGQIVLVNPAMESAPEIVNQDPYNEGWLCEIKPSQWATDQTQLLDAAAYFNQMKGEAEAEVKNQ